MGDLTAMRRFNASETRFEADFAAFLDEPRGSPAEVDEAVAAVIERVRTEGLRAVLDYTRRFDRVELDEETIGVSAREIADGAAQCPAEVRDAIAFAAGRIRAFHERQRPAD